MDVISTASTELAKKLVRPELLGLEPYQSARRIGGQGDIWINANESPFNNTELDGINRYPECQPPALINAYAQYSNILPNHVLCTRGADEAIELLIRTYCRSGIDSIAYFAPTYGMYAISAETSNIKANRLELDDNYKLPNAFKSQITTEKIIFLCNPNNPTGTLLPETQIVDMLESYPNKLIVIDEAYVEFCPNVSFVKKIQQYSNLVILRTLSKAFALAGLRCGFLLANSGIIEMIMRVIAPYPVPHPVVKYATSALSSNGISNMISQVSLLNEQGIKLSQALNKHAEKVLPSSGNFVLAFFKNSETIQNLLTNSGIVARFYNDEHLKNAIRFSYTNQQSTIIIINALNR